MALTIYLKDEQYNWLLADLNFACDEAKKREILERAVGDMEADLSEKFVVPLINKDGGAYSTCQAFARNKIVNALKAKIREIIGYDKNRNLTGTIESTEKFLNVHGIEYKDQLKGLMNPRIAYGFQLQDQAQDAVEPVQHLGLARADNTVDPLTEDDPFIP